MIAMIAACAENNVIGKDGKIPWNIKEDMTHFKNLTTNNVLIMGRKTFLSIGKPLPERFTVVVSSSLKIESNECRSVSSIKEAFDLAKEISSGKINCPPVKKNADIFIAGGEQIYRATMELTEKIFLTQIQLKTEGDAFFPEIDLSRFKITERKTGTEKNAPHFEFITYEKK